MGKECARKRDRATSLAKKRQRNVLRSELLGTMNRDDFFTSDEKESSESGYSSSDESCFQELNDIVDESEVSLLSYSAERVERKQRNTRDFLAFVRQLSDSNKERLLKANAAPTNEGEKSTAIDVRKEVSTEGKGRRKEKTQAEPPHIGDIAFLLCLSIMMGAAVSNSSAAAAASSKSFISNEDTKTTASNNGGKHPSQLYPQRIRSSNSTAGKLKVNKGKSRSHGKIENTVHEGGAFFFRGRIH